MRQAEQALREFREAIESLRRASERYGPIDAREQQRREAAQRGAA